MQFHVKVSCSQHNFTGLERSLPIKRRGYSKKHVIDLFKLAMHEWTIHNNDRHDEIIQMIHHHACTLCRLAQHEFEEILHVISLPRSPNSDALPTHGLNKTIGRNAAQRTRRRCFLRQTISIIQLHCQQSRFEELRTTLIWMNRQLQNNDLLRVFEYVLETWAKYNPERRADVIATVRQCTNDLLQMDEQQFNQHFGNILRRQYYTVQIQQLFAVRPVKIAIGQIQQALYSMIKDPTLGKGDQDFVILQVKEMAKGSTGERRRVIGMFVEYLMEQKL